MAKKTKPQAMTLPDEAVTDNEGFQPPADMPELKGVDHLFPSARFALLHKALGLVNDLQDSGLDEIDAGEETDENDIEVFGKLVPAMEQSEQLLLSQAKDRAAMEKWLLESVDLEDSIQRSLAGIMVITERLGNLHRRRLCDVLQERSDS